MKECDSSNGGCLELSCPHNTEKERKWSGRGERHIENDREQESRGLRCISCVKGRTKYPGHRVNNNEIQRPKL